MAKALNQTQIQPMKLSSHLQRPQILAPPLLDVEVEDEDEGNKNPIELEFKKHKSLTRGRDLRLHNRSQHRRIRSLSPLPHSQRSWFSEEDDVGVE